MCVVRLVTGRMSVLTNKMTGMDIMVDQVLGVITAKNMVTLPEIAKMREWREISEITMMKSGVTIVRDSDTLPETARKRGGSK